MSREPVVELDAVVLGGNIRGLVTAWLLSSLGFRAVLLERASRVGGADGSFVTPGGSRFDHGLHLLDFMRSELATRLFTSVLDGRVHRLVLRRGIVLRNHVLPYAPLPSELPDELRALLPGDDLVDDLGDALPTRARLAAIYGRGFADLVFDEVLPSYRCEARHLAFGVDEARLLTNVHPWLLPRAKRPGPGRDASRSFHERLRAGIPQEVLYPEEGGFGGFAEGFLRKLDPQRVTVHTGLSDLHVEVERERHEILYVEAGGLRYQAPRYFWAAAWPGLCALLDLPCQEVATDRLVLGSFRLDRPAHTPYHELLVGDPTHRINRISFPAAFRHSEEPLMQVEFAFPVAESWPLEARAWRSLWLEDTRRLGLLDEDHRVEEFDFRSFTMHYNGFGMEGEPLRDADPALLHPGSNVHPVVPSMANLNLNTYVPAVVRQVADVLADGRGRA